QYPQPAVASGPGPRRWVAPSGQHVAGQPGTAQVLRRPAHGPRHRLQRRGVGGEEEEGGGRSGAEQPQARPQRLGRRLLQRQRAVQVEAVHVQVVHRGAAAQPVEAHAESGVAAEQRRLQRPAQHRGRQHLRQPPRRLRQQQDVSPPQRAGVDGHQQRVGRRPRASGAAQAEQQLGGAQPGEVEGAGVEGIPEAADGLRRAALRAALLVQLRHEAHGAGQDAGGQRSQPVPEHSPLHTVAPARQQQPVEAGGRGVRVAPAGCLQHEVPLAVHEHLGVRLARRAFRHRGHPGDCRPQEPAVCPGGRGWPSCGCACPARGGQFRGSGPVTCGEKRRHGRLSQSGAAGLAERVPGADVPEQAGDLAANPFRDQICRVFSTSETKDDMSFEDFLDMLSAFSDSATSDIKSHYAFHIFDFDDDGTLDRKDLERVVNCLTGLGEESRLSSEEMEQLIQNILEESDIDKDGTINLAEFQHVVSRSPDFASSFKIVL
uniref:EF-hand domain-containing protein n=1 Tax=Cyanoderma ruficeps TaxID=181631 RepID=A0A8C3RER2_9PASS